MEIVLQWLDDCDDIIYSLAMSCERLRLRSLETGFIAALSVPLLIVGNVWAPLISTYALTACGCFAFWAAGVVGSGFLDPRVISA